MMIPIARSFFIFVLLLQAPLLPAALAVENPGTSQLLNELEEVKKRIASIEKQQQDIVDKDNEIIAKLDQLRVWVHRK